MTDPKGRSQKDRLVENIRLMDELGEGKGRGFILPGTAKEIARDLRELDRAVRGTSDAE